MRSIHRHGLFSQVLLMLGVVGLPPPPTREQLDAEALAETERVKVDLEAAGLSAAEVVEAVGPERFAKVGRLLLALQKHRRSLGQEPSTADLLQTLRAIEVGPFGNPGTMRVVVDSCTPTYTERARPSDIRDEFAKRAEIQKFTNEMVRLGEACRIATDTKTWATLCSLPRESRTHNRKTQRASKKARTAAKKRRGW